MSQTSTTPQTSAIKLTNVGKMYKLFDRPLDNLLDAIGMTKWFGSRKKRFNEFWALRNINLELAKGSRVGLIGCNGAGKTTLLKLITQNFQPTEGTVAVHGEVQALMTSGSGFHPEFSGLENIRSALAYEGFHPSEIEEAMKDIADFTELGPFLNQPLKVYSAGMQARLTFATATVVRPDILIIDEVLGAGDGYFSQKCNERIQNLVDSGATVIVVSHAMDQITKLCTDAIWLDRGRVVQQGTAVELVKAYDEHLRKKTAIRLRAKNYKRQSNNITSYEQLDNCTASVLSKFTNQGEENSKLCISEIHIHEDGEALESLRVGEPQDTSQTLLSYVVIDNTTGWSVPVKEDDRMCRYVESINQENGNAGLTLQNLFAMEKEKNYEVAITFKEIGNCDSHVDFLLTGKELPPVKLQGKPGEWTTQRILLQAASEQQNDLESEAPIQSAVRRWPGLGSLLIQKLEILDRNEQSTVLIEAGQPAHFQMTFEAMESGTYPITPAIVFLRKDGLMVTQLIGDEVTLSLDKGESVRLRLQLDSLNVGDGEYLISTAIYKWLDLNEKSHAEHYDMLDRSFEVEVFGNLPMYSVAVFRHQGSQWTWHTRDSVIVTSEKQIGKSSSNDTQVA